MNEYLVTWMFALMYKREFYIVAESLEDAQIEASNFLQKQYQYPASEIRSITQVL